MVQVRDNLTELEGTISAREPHARLSDFDDIVVQIERADPVPGKAQLVRASPGDALRVAVRGELLASAAPGARVRLRVARTSSGEVMAEPHPAPEHFSLVPPAGQRS